MENRKFILIIIGIFIFVLISLALIKYTLMTKEISNFTSEDFKVLGISWNEEPEEWDWAGFCGFCRSGNNCETEGAHLIVQSSMTLKCTQKINGITTRKHGVKSGLRDINVYSNVVASKNNEIIMCCSSPYKQGEICGSANLPPKCV